MFDKVFVLTFGENARERTIIEIVTLEFLCLFLVGDFTQILGVLRSRITLDVIVNVNKSDFGIRMGVVDWRFEE